MTLIGAAERTVSPSCSTTTPCKQPQSHTVSLLYVAYIAYLSPCVLLYTICLSRDKIVSVATVQQSSDAPPQGYPSQTVLYQIYRHIQVFCRGMVTCSRQEGVGSRTLPVVRKLEHVNSLRARKNHCEPSESVSSHRS